MTVIINILHAHTLHPRHAPGRGRVQRVLGRRTTAGAAAHDRGAREPHRQAGRGSRAAHEDDARRSPRDGPVVPGWKDPAVVRARGRPRRDVHLERHHHGGGKGLDGRVAAVESQPGELRVHRPGPVVAVASSPRTQRVAGVDRRPPAADALRSVPGRVKCPPSKVAEMARVARRVANWIVLTSVALSTACFSSAPPPAARAGAAAPPSLWGDLKPIVSVKELMKYMIDPLADNIFNAVGTRVTRKGVVDVEPKTDEDWDRIRTGAISLAEGAYLLKVRRPFAPAGDENNSVGPNAVELS